MHSRSQVCNVTSLRVLRWHSDDTEEESVSSPKTDQANSHVAPNEDDENDELYIVRFIAVNSAILIMLIQAPVQAIEASHEPHLLSLLESS